MRVTHQVIQRSTLGNLRTNLIAMSELQAKLSSGKSINKASDDPAGAAHSLKLRSDYSAAVQQQRNADDGVGWLSTIDSALTSATAALRQARDLTVQGGNSGALSQSSREALAQEIEGVRDAMLDFANTKYLNRSVFAGTSNAATAFDAATYTYNGSTGSSVERQVAADTTIRADSPGGSVFGTGTGSVFALLDTIASDLRAGNDVSGHLNEIDTHMQNMLGEVASVGARYSRMLDAQNETADRQVKLKGQLSAIEDVDLASVIVEMQMQEVAYQGALGATAKVLQPTLLDFLR